MTSSGEFRLDKQQQLRTEKTAIEDQIGLLKATQSDVPYGKGSLGNAERKVAEKILELQVKLINLREKELTTEKRMFHLQLHLAGGGTLDTEAYSSPENLAKVYSALLNRRDAYDRPLVDTHPFVPINPRNNWYAWIRDPASPKFHYVNPNLIVAITIVETKVEVS